MIFPLTVIAHGKDGHGGFGPVIRNIIDDRVPWTTIGAVYEWVEVPSVLLVEEFL
jgi:hypothetical protein